MKSKKAVTAAALFLALLIALSLCFLLLPKRGYSDNENRYLTPQPEFTFKSLFSGDFTARIRGFNTLDAVNGAEVTALAGNLSDIEFWNFDTESSIAGSFVNDFAGDTFDVELTTGWDGSETTLFSGDVTGFEKMTTVTLGGEIATWDLDAEISRYASSSYQLTFDAENKVVKFGLLA